MVKIKGKKKLFAKGKRGNKKRIHPNPPNFNKILANIIEPIVGAST